MKKPLDQGVGPQELNNAPFEIKLGRFIERGKLKTSVVEMLITVCIDNDTGGGIALLLCECIEKATLLLSYGGNYQSAQVGNLFSTTQLISRGTISLWKQLKLIFEHFFTV